MQILGHFEKSLFTLNDFTKLMQYNGYKNRQNDFPDDPSYNNPGDGISARYELTPDVLLRGGIDFKVKYT